MESQVRTLAPNLTLMWAYSFQNRQNRYFLVTICPKEVFFRLSGHRDPPTGRKTHFWTMSKNNTDMAGLRFAQACR